MELTHKRLAALLMALLMALAALPAPAEEAEAPGNFFASMELTYLDGSPFDASVFEGMPILMNIWATWCGPCVAELPDLEEVHQALRDKIHIIGLHSEGLAITEDGKLEPNEETNLLAMGLQEEKKLTFPLLNPDVKMTVLMRSAEYGLRVAALPTTWLIDREGYVRQVIRGGHSKEEWEKIIEDFLTTLDSENDGQEAG